VGTAVFLLGAPARTSIEGRIDVQIHIKTGNDDGWSLEGKLRRGHAFKEAPHNAWFSPNRAVSENGGQGLPAAIVVGGG
jgi:hypothetical protein